jgi:hypothetical protein
MRVFHTFLCTHRGWQMKLMSTTGRPSLVQNAGMFNLILTTLIYLENFFSMGVWVGPLTSPSLCYCFVQPTITHTVNKVGNSVRSVFNIKNGIDLIGWE